MKADTTTLAHGASFPPVMGRGCKLLVTDGPDRGRELVIEDLVTRRALVGQSASCDVRLVDRTVSRRHAALEVDDEGLRVIDLGSTNGTFVDRVRVREAFVAEGAELRLGATALRVSLDARSRPLEASTEAGFFRVIGGSPEMRRLYPTFARIAQSDVPVLVEGETGTGKEVLAESIHEASGRREGPFVVLDCTTVAPSLIEAELFGHEKGAFTGAVSSRPGLFEEASGGTLFVDEIGDLDVSLQGKLLRAIERSEVRRVGGSKWAKVDVRIVAATRRDLDREVVAQRFRDDLFYRLAVARVELPPLRRRHGDIALLARHFWIALGGDPAALTPEIVQRFEEHDWPGNVRELHNAVARQLALGDASISRAASALERRGDDFLDLVVRKARPLTMARQEIVAEFERRYVKHMLELHGGNVSRTATACGIGRRYLQMIRAKL
jgi:DNA-binding NtrC family response regulator